MQEKLAAWIKEAIKSLSFPEKEIILDFPANLENGDYSSNIAMVLSKELKKSPLEIAKLIKEILAQDILKGRKPEGIEKIEVAPPGFINFYFSGDALGANAEKILGDKDKFGRKPSNNKKVMVEYTDPNPFKEFHIGHLMSNAIGESISRLLAFEGMEVKHACYQGDVGLHVAKTIWALIKKGAEPASVGDLGKAYAEGASAHEESEQVKKEINEINKKIYERTDEKINKLYDLGKKISLEHFEEIYKKLGTKFDFYFFESESGQFGKKIINQFMAEGIFVESEGAIVFRGEEYDPKLHTRVFVNKEGLPTYEAKELGLAKIKHDKYPYDLSVVVTGNEVNDYFRVLMKALELTFPELAKKTRHVSHGMLRLPTGKMSSRTGQVITGESLLDDVSGMVREKMASRDFNQASKEKISGQVAVAAVKYSILKQSAGKDIIFDFEKSISFEGDSGPYLQYSGVRVKSLIEKAENENIKIDATRPADFPKSDLERLLVRFPEVVSKASEYLEPHRIITYLLELTHTFSSFYGEERIVDPKDPSSPYKLALSQAFYNTLENGLWLLGIEIPEKM
jgi:arginyl-tRNA synthetase